MIRWKSAVPPRPCIALCCLNNCHVDLCVAIHYISAHKVLKWSSERGIGSKSPFISSRGKGLIDHSSFVFVGWSKLWTAFFFFFKIKDKILRHAFTIFTQAFVSRPAPNTTTTHLESLVQFPWRLKTERNKGHKCGKNSLCNYNWKGWEMYRVFREDWECATHGDDEGEQILEQKNRTEWKGVCTVCTVNPLSLSPLCKAAQCMRNPGRGGDEGKNRHLGRMTQISMSVSATSARGL